MEGERVEVMGGSVHSSGPPMCLIWGAVETLGWAASAKSKQKWLKGTERLGPMLHRVYVTAFCWLRIL